MRLVILFLILTVAELWGVAGSEMPGIVSMRERAVVRDGWLEKRLNTVVPQLMRREGVDMWVLIAREYNEDPVVKTMLPAKWHSARRRTILVFFDNGKDVERLAVARYNIGQFFAKAWDKEKQPNQWLRLKELIEEKAPKKIAINVSTHFALADGLSHSEYESFHKVLPKELQARLVPGENLAIGWLETRIPEEMAVYPQICRIAHAIIAEGFSSKVVHPGITTSSDVEWFYRERIRELKLQTWFHPTVAIQRSGEPEHSGVFSSKPEENIILPGDLLHVDFGIEYLGLNTDTQQHAYVLRQGETRAPEGLVKALAIGNRLQDILTEQYVTGRSGNQILAGALKMAEKEGIDATIYTHPIGYHGHGAGPTIGLWDQQGGVSGKGDYPLYANTAYSIELNAAVPVPEWSKTIRIMLEEDGYFTGNSFYYIDGRQTELILIQ